MPGLHCGEVEIPKDGLREVDWCVCLKALRVACSHTWLRRSSDNPPIVCRGNRNLTSNATDVTALMWLAGLKMPRSP